MTSSIGSAMARKPPSWTARMVALDVAEGMMPAAPVRLQALFELLMPPETVALTAQVVARIPGGLSPAQRLLMCVRQAGAWLRRHSLLGLSSVRNSLNAALRKRIFYDEVVAAIEAGARQVIMLGAGYDVLCLQLHRRYPHVLFVEVDQENTQRLKRRAVMQLYGGTLPANYAFVSVDFRYQSLPDELTRQLGGAWNEQYRSVAVIEGVWPYLTEQGVRSSLQSFRRIAAPGSTYLFTYFVLTGSPLQRRLTELSTRVFALVGEPVHYLPGSRQEIEQLLAAEGYRADLSVARMNGYQRYIVPAGFGNELPAEAVLSDFSGVAVSI
jgi:methyltransferase (TIGR00027 family)